MKWCLFISVLFPVLAWAKPSAPMINKLHLTSIQQEQDANLYLIQLDFTPLVDSKRIKLALKIPQDFSLLEGFSYWEGSLNSGQTFKKILKIKAPLSQEGKIEVSATMEMETTKSTTISALTLGSSQLNKSSSEIIEPELGKIRRE